MVVKLLVVDTIKEIECCGMLIERASSPTDRTKDIYYRPNRKWYQTKIGGAFWGEEELGKLMLCGGGQISITGRTSTAPTQVSQDTVYLCAECATRNGLTW